MTKRFVFLACAMLFGSLESQAITLTLLPTSSISGAAGSAIGWGYSISNPSPSWVETLNLSSGVFANGAPQSIFDFPVVGPFSTVTLAYSTVVTGSCASPPCGLYQLTWNPGAPPGFSNSGQFVLSSEDFATNPLTDPNAIDLGAEPDATANYVATVTGSAVPEPSAIGLCAGLLILGMVSKTHFRALKQ